MATNGEKQKEVVICIHQEGLVGGMYPLVSAHMLNGKQGERDRLGARKKQFNQSHISPY